MYDGTFIKRTKFGDVLCLDGKVLCTFDIKSEIAILFYNKHWYCCCQTEKNRITHVIDSWTRILYKKRKELCYQ